MDTKRISIVLFAICCMAPLIQAQIDLVYQLPPDRLVKFVDAAPTPAVSISPDGSWMIIMERPGLPSIAEIARPELRLAGLRINPRTNGPSRGSHITGLKLLSLEDNLEYEVSGLPEAPRISRVAWSPDGGSVAFCRTQEDGIELWVLDLETKHAGRLTGPDINDVTGSTYEWHPDSRSLIYKSIDNSRVSPPAPSRVPVGPVVQENTGRKSPVRTYQDMLKNPYDERVFEYYATSRLISVSLSGISREIGSKGIIRSFDISPDGQYLLVQSVHRPFSYLVPYSRFPARIEVWDLQGNLLHTVADLPLADDIPSGFGSVRKGPRSVQWRSDAPAQLFWVEALDEGDGSKDVPYRDQVFALKAPFRGDVEEGPRCELRFGGITWGNSTTALLYESWRRTRTEIVSRFEPDRMQEGKQLIFDLNTEDRYGDPGSFVTTTNASGNRILLFGNGGRSLYLRGTGASPRGNEPFVDRYDLSSGETTRLWQSGPPYYEYPTRILDPGKGLILVSRESVKEQPNYYLLNLRSGKSVQVTRFPHPHPDLSGLDKQLITYLREDGVQLTGTLYLPYREASRNRNLPVIMWAYPREYKDADAAGQVDESPYRFDRITHGSTLVWLTQGYAVFDDPKMPIIGEGDEEPNDTYVEQLVSSAKAAVDTVVAMGVADPGKIVIGGHSYGAFMTANLLSHSDLFAAGIARSGAYNRTLTPFGFQAEERTYWEAPQVYYDMSPFMHAHKINEPLLLIHGQADNNSGTFPVQSERYYHALKGQGATVRLVMLPHESHGYRARESVLHMLWETDRWIRRYVTEGSREE
jgi:dipeptidyl aminopeptidase/acylaminoacyl peptidase